MTTQHSIDAELERAYGGEAWHGSAFGQLLDGINEREAAARPVPSAHSIWEIVRHVSAWLDIVNRRLAGERLIDVDDREDWPEVGDTSASAWTETRQVLAARHRALVGAVRAMSADAIERPVPGLPYSAAFMLSGTVQHLAYHGGQVALLRKALAAAPK